MSRKLLVAVFPAIRSSASAAKIRAKAGAGALVFDPTRKSGEFVPGAQYQARATFLYGGGVDYELTRHFTLRAEYRGFVYERLDFGLQELHSGSTTHTAQPSAGIVFRF
jgi:opacity protein-like surface antigen